MKIKMVFLNIFFMICLIVISFYNINTSLNAETVTIDWVVHENVTDLKVSNITEGGIGRISYFTIPEEGTDAVPNGHKDDRIYNSVFIPISNYDITSNRVSIKYNTNVDVTGQNVVLYARCDESISSSGNVIPAEDVLIGWFENWNVQKNKSIDNVDYITVNHNNYTNERNVTGIVMNFTYDDGNPDNEKWMDVLGVTFHESNVTPTFASDPTLPSIGTLTTTSGNLTNITNGYALSLDGSATINVPFSKWNKAISDNIVMNVKTFNGLVMKIKKGIDIVYEKAFTDDKTVNVDLVFKDSSLTNITIDVTGKGSIEITDLKLTTRPKVMNYSTSNLEYFSNFENVEDGPYQLNMTRNTEGGFPKVIASISNYRSSYDVLCIDIYAVSDVSLLGITFNDTENTYIINHWDADNFIDVGEHKLTFFNLGKMCENWDGKSFAIYVNSSATEKNGYTYKGEIKLGISFAKSEDFKTPEISFNQEKFVFDYDGTKHSITPIITPATLSYEIVYKSTNEESSTGVQNAGEYTVFVTALGNREYKSVTKTVSLVINKTVLPAPTATDFEISYTQRVIGFDEDIIVNKSNTFEEKTKVLSGTTIEPGQVLYAKRPKSDNGTESPIFTLTIPELNDAPINVTSSSTETVITVQKIENAEYCLISEGVAGAWQDYNIFNNLNDSTEYEVKVRIKASETSFESKECVISIKTKAKLPNSDDLSTDPAQPTTSPSSSRCNGCQGSTDYSSIAFLFGITLFWSVARLIIIKHRRDSM